MPNVRVLFSCTGVGIFNRGIESFFREAFDGLKDAMPGIEARLLKGADEGGNGKNIGAREKAIWCLPRIGRLAPLIGKLTGRSAYAVEQWSSFLPVAQEIRRWKPHVIFYSDANLGFLLYRFRKQIGVPFRLLFSNGGPVQAPFIRTDFVHQVAPLYLQEALAAGEPKEKHFMIPYGIKTNEPPVLDWAEKRLLRQKLGLPFDQKFILSVGWIAREHKRMDYVIEEVAKLPAPRPFLQLLGAMDEKSQEVVDFGVRKLGVENFSVKSVPYEQVNDYYRAADCFVLASLKEGYGRVYLEALMHGLPTIGHHHPVIEYVLGDVGIKGDLSREGELTSLLMHVLRQPARIEASVKRWEAMRDRFSWSTLAPKYREMFCTVAT